MEELTFDLSRIQLVDHSDKWLEILKNSSVDIVNHAIFKEVEDGFKLINLEEAYPGIYQTFVLIGDQFVHMEIDETIHTYFYDIEQLQTLDELLILPYSLRAKLLQLEIEDCKYVAVLYIKNQDSKVYYIGSYKPSEKVSLT